MGRRLHESHFLRSTLGSVRLEPIDLAGQGLSLSSEADADRMGLFLVARAGFDPWRAIEFLSSWEAVDEGARGPQINTGGIYESASGRRRALQPVLQDIAARKADGRALIP